MHPRCCQPVAWKRKHRGCITPQAVNTQSSASEDGQSNCPKHVELIGIINKPLTEAAGVRVWTVFMQLRTVSDGRLF